MTQLSGSVHQLEAQLATMDRTLRGIQADLLGEGEPPHRESPSPGETETESHEPPPPEPPPPEPPPPPPEPPRQRGRSGPLASALQHSPRPRERRAERPSPPIEEPDPQTKALTELYARLLSTTRQLLDGYEVVLSQMTRATPAAPPPTTGEQEHPAETLTLSAGPFDSTSAAREFAHHLLGLPGVREVELRGYEGADRAIIDVELEP